MKLNKLSLILLNLILILVIVFLLKSIITMPKDLHASPVVEYKIIDLEETFGDYVTAKQLTQFVNGAAKDGWKLHTYAMGVIVLER